MEGSYWCMVEVSAYAWKGSAKEEEEGEEEEEEEEG